LEILYYKNLDSTHLEILRVLKKTKKEICIVADIQSSGIGSRNNSWQSHYGNLFFSFSSDNSKLPSDLKLQSYSIYFGYLLKSVLVELGFDVWFKWPNDIYKQNRKIAGVITSVKSGFIICGIGVNLISTNEYKGLDATVSKDTILKIFFDKIKKNITWQEPNKLYRGLTFKSLKDFNEFKDKFPRIGYIHISLLLAGIFILIAFYFYFARFDLLTSPHGAVMGAGYTDVHVVLPAMGLIAVISLIFAAISIYLGYKQNLEAMALLAIVLAIVTFLSIVAAPAMIQKLKVEPNELAREEEYIK